MVSVTFVFNFELFFLYYCFQFKIKQPPLYTVNVLYLECTDKPLSLYKRMWGWKSDECPDYSHS